MIELEPSPELIVLSLFLPSNFVASRPRANPSNRYLPSAAPAITQVEYADRLVDLDLKLDAEHENLENATDSDPDLTDVYRAIDAIERQKTALFDEARDKLVSLCVANFEAVQHSFIERTVTACTDAIRGQFVSYVLDSDNELSLENRVKSLFKEVARNDPGVDMRDVVDYTGAETVAIDYRALIYNKDAVEEKRRLLYKRKKLQRAINCLDYGVPEVPASGKRQWH